MHIWEGMFNLAKLNLSYLCFCSALPWSLTHVNRLVCAGSHDSCILNIQSYWSTENWTLQSHLSPHFSCDSEFMFLEALVSEFSQLSEGEKQLLMQRMKEARPTVRVKKCHNLHFIIPVYSWLQIGPFTLLMTAIDHQTEQTHEHRSYVRVKFLDVRHSWSL